MVMGGMAAVCNPKLRENGPSWQPRCHMVGHRSGLFRTARGVRGEGPEAYTEEVERIRWKEIQENNEKSVTERNGVSMFLALVDDECHELIPGSHTSDGERRMSTMYSYHRR